MKVPLYFCAPMALAAGLLPSAVKAGSFVSISIQAFLLARLLTAVRSSMLPAVLAGGALKITTNVNSLQGSYIIDDLDAGGPVNSFTATFKARVGGGTHPPADGWSFCFATDLPLGSWSEEGAGTGLFHCLRHLRERGCG